MRTKIFTFFLAIMVLFVLSTNVFALTTYTVGGTNSAATYSSVARAIVAINNAGGISGSVILELQSDYAPKNSCDTIVAVTGASATNTITVRPASGVTSLTLSGGTTPTFFLNGCQYVIVDGRPGGIGDMTNIALTISNTSTTGFAMRFMLDASYNTIQYVNIKGVNTGNTGGVVLFGSSSVTGCDYNTIDHCNIHEGATTPTNCIISTGNTTTAYFNDHITISNNNIYNYNDAAAAITNGGYGVYFSAGTSDSKITGNSFYQTATRGPLFAGAITGAININVSAGNGFIVSNNYIGGSATQCGGTAYTLTGTSNQVFRGIQFSCGTTTPSAIYGNIIKNLDITSVATAAPTNANLSSGIYNIAGSAYIGYQEDGSTVSGNKIGDQSSSTVGANASIKFSTSGTFDSGFNGIVLYNGTANANLTAANNKIGGIYISAPATATSKCYFYGIGIYKSAASGSTQTYTIADNEIGNNDTKVDSTLMSIQNKSQGRPLYGIYAGGGTSGVLASVTISGNKIGNLFCSSLGTNNPGFAHGMDLSSYFSFNVDNNTIHDIVSAGVRNNAGDVQAGGIVLAGVAGMSNSITKNTIYNIQGVENDRAVNNDGIWYTGTTDATEISQNKIYNISSISTLKFPNSSNGIAVNVLAANTATVKVNNNVVRMGYDRFGNAVLNAIALTGIRDSSVTTGSANVSYYYNTVYIDVQGVTSTLGYPTAAFFLAAGQGVTRVVKDNIFVNARSNSAAGGSSHYAIFNRGAMTGFTLNYNDYAVTGTDGVLGNFGGIDVADLTTLKATTSQDVNSLNVTPVFVGATIANPNLHLLAGANDGLKSKGTSISGITIDCEDVVRNASAPTLGAYETLITNTDILKLDLSSGNGLKAYSVGCELFVTDLKSKDVVTVYTVSGMQVTSKVVVDNLVSVTLPSGIYIVKVKSADVPKVAKVIVK